MFLIYKSVNVSEQAIRKKKGEGKKKGERETKEKKKKKGGNAEKR